MSIDLFIEPGKVYTWEDFLTEKPPFSIGLDGIISGPTMRDNYGPYANFDHHHPSIDRLSTRSTSAQVHMEINMGLFDVFKKKGVPYVNIFINDPDEDACLSSFQLKHHELVKGHGNPKLNRLVYCEDMLDCTAGAYPFGDIRIRRQMAWIFLPYTEARFEKRLGDMGIAEMRDVVEAVYGRIEQYLFEECGEIALDGHYERIGGGKKWALVKKKHHCGMSAMLGTNPVAAVLADGAGSHDLDGHLGALPLGLVDLAVAAAAEHVADVKLLVGDLPVVMDLAPAHGHQQHHDDHDGDDHQQRNGGKH